MTGRFAGYITPLPMDDVPVDDATFMRHALHQADLAGAAGEVPVGAVVVCGGQVIAVGRNAPVAYHDPSAHAEIVALRAAAAVLGNYRLADCTLYASLEPCAMCSGAILHARIRRLVFAAADPKTGAAGSVVDLFAYPQLNHQTAVTAGVLASESSALLTAFFQARRQQQRSRAIARHPLHQDALRPADAVFAAWAPPVGAIRNAEHLPALAGLRMRFVDTGAASQGAASPQRAPLVWLMLHDSGSWSAMFHSWAAVGADAGHRVLLPDLPGFGRSDKPKKEAAHGPDLHARVLAEWAESLHLQQIVLVVQAHGAWCSSRVNLLDDAWVAPVLQALAARVAGVVWIEPGVPEAGPNARRMPAEIPMQALRDAPFPDDGHRAALRAWVSRRKTVDSSLTVAADTVTARRAAVPVQVPVAVIAGNAADDLSGPASWSVPDPWSVTTVRALMPQLVRYFTG